MNLPPSGDPRWPDLAAPVLAFLRTLPGGATWPALTAWMRSKRWTITRASNALAWLEGEGLARSSGGREVKPGLARVTKNKWRRREARVGADEEVRWWAVQKAPAAPPPAPAGAPCPVVRGKAPPAVLPPLRGPFLSPRPASPSTPLRRADPDPGIRVSPDGPLRLPSADRALREEACVHSNRGARRLAERGVLGGPGSLPSLRMPPKNHYSTKEAERREKVKARKSACAPVPEAMKRPLRPPQPSPPRREAHPATCGCAECD